MKAHRLANHAQHYESYQTVYAMTVAQEMFDKKSDMEIEHPSLDELVQRCADSEREFYKAIRTFNEFHGDDPDRPVLINGIIYQAKGEIEHHVIRIDPETLQDVVTENILVTKRP